ncbi:MAG: hypothetical protein AB7I29_13740 [Geobacter sp.]
MLHTTIYKYELQPGETHINMPAGAKVLTTASQQDKVFIWAEVDPAAEAVTRRIFQAFATGQIIRQGTGISREYIGTVHMGPMNCNLVFHIYEYIGV